MRTTYKIAVALTAGFMATAAADDEPNLFLGNWSGVWPNGQHNEFNVVAVNEEGQITALYCAERPDGSGFWFDVVPDGIESSIRRRILRFTRPELKMKYRFTLTGDNTLTFRYTRKGKHNTLEMARRETSGCAARIAPPAPE